jgi:Secretion system C-terminal sorting domain
MKKQTNILRTIFFLFSIFFSLFSTSAQQANVASGGNTTGTGGSLSYSIGQVAYTNQVGTNGSVNQGVQQPFEIFTLGNDDFPEITLLMTVYPNPTTSFINLNIQNYSTENMYYQLFDITGKQIQSQKITTTETQIQMENVASAVYLLNVIEENRLLKTFKIIKNN